MAEARLYGLRVNAAGNQQCGLCTAESMEVGADVSGALYSFNVTLVGVRGFGGVVREPLFDVEPPAPSAKIVGV